MKSPVSIASTFGKGRFRLDRFTFLTLLLLPWFASGCLTPSGDTDNIRRLGVVHYPEEEFQRISEFFTGKENPGRRIIARTDPSRRAGWYFSVRLRENPYRQEMVENAVLLEVIRPGQAEAAQYRFTLGPVPRRNPEFLIGLTGEEWSSRAASPTAWQLTFFDATGEVAARRKSFLWGDPPPPPDN